MFSLFKGYLIELEEYHHPRSLAKRYHSVLQFTINIEQPSYSIPLYFLPYEREKTGTQATDPVCDITL